MAEPSTLARPYAKAAFDHALEHNELAAWSQELALLATLVDIDKVASAIDRPAYTAGEQARLLLDLAGDELTPAVQNFVRIIAENKRLALLGEVHRQFEGFKARQEQSIDVGVATAWPLEESVKQQLGSALTQKLKREVTLNIEVDRSLLGGVVIRAGDLVIDSSVRGRLARLARAMNS